MSPTRLREEHLYASSTAAEAKTDNLLDKIESLEEKVRQLEIENKQLQKPRSLSYDEIKDDDKLVCNFEFSL